MRHGYGVFTSASGERYYGSWKNGKKDGTGIMLEADGSTFEVCFVDCDECGVLQLITATGSMGR